MEPVLPTYPASALPDRKAIYQLLKPGELLQARDAVYLAAIDEWWQIGVSHPALVGTPFDPESMGPVRRFNK